MKELTAEEMIVQMNAQLREVEEHIDNEENETITRLDSEIKELTAIEKKDDLGF